MLLLFFIIACYPIIIEAIYGIYNHNNPTLKEAQSYDFNAIFECPNSVNLT